MRIRPMTNFFLDRRKQLEKKLGRRLSQYAMALRVGCTPNMIGYWERGESIPPLGRAPKLAEAYEVSVSKIEQVIVEMRRETVVSR